MTRLVALAGESRSGKGTCAAVFAEEAAAAGLTSFERQLSDNGKWHLARIFKPTISRADAVTWFEQMKSLTDVKIQITSASSGWPGGRATDIEVALQKFLQHALQQGGRDIFGEHFWTDMIIPEFDGDSPYSQRYGPDEGRVSGESYVRCWLDKFFDDESGSRPTDLAIISDLRQPNEAQRVNSCRGRVIQLVRPHADDQYKTGSDHITERMLPFELVDHVIANDGDLEHLKETARVVFYKFVLPWLKEQE